MEQDQVSLPKDWRFLFHGVPVPESTHAEFYTWAFYLGSAQVRSVAAVVVPDGGRFDVYTVGTDSQ